MKTIKLLFTAGLIAGFSQLGLAQSSGSAQSKAQIKSTDKVVNNADRERAARANDNGVVIKKVENPEKLQRAKRIDVEAAKAKPAPASRAKRVNNTHKALPANYKPSVQETKEKK